MKVVMVIETPDNSYDNAYNNVVEPMHQFLKGREDYVNSNIVLALDKEDNVPVCTIGIDLANCWDQTVFFPTTKKMLELAFGKPDPEQQNVKIPRFEFRESTRFTCSDCGKTFSINNRRFCPMCGSYPWCL